MHIFFLLFVNLKVFLGNISRKLYYLSTLLCQLLFHLSLQIRIHLFLYANAPVLSEAPVSKLPNRCFGISSIQYHLVTTTSQTVVLKLIYFSSPVCKLKSVLGNISRKLYYLSTLLCQLLFHLSLQIRIHLFLSMQMLQFFPKRLFQNFPTDVSVYFTISSGNHHHLWF